MNTKVFFVTLYLSKADNAMRRFPVLIFLFLLCPNFGNAIERRGLKQALSEGLVRLEAIGSGQSFLRNGLKIRLTNLSKGGVLIHVEPALLFRPIDTNYQDLICVGNETIPLAANASREVDLATFCAKAHAAAPADSLPFRYIGQADSLMQQLLSYLRLQRLQDFLGQQAVWAMTDFHNLEGVFDTDRPKESFALLDFMQKLVGQSRPEFFKIYGIDTSAGQAAFVNRILKIATQMQWQQERTATLDLGIFNEQGKLIQTVFAKNELKRGKYKINIKFKAEHAPKGLYYLRLTEADKVLKQQEFSLD